MEYLSYLIQLSLSVKLLVNDLRVKFSFVLQKKDKNKHIFVF